ncbi:MAG: A/G-specific adenine glycosylase [Campylobacterota bacterium]|nr:A/G-specific adenine glycosylase [Campylobacterota bacterium]
MYKNIHDILYLWYQDNGRHDLPWRHTSDAYTIWVSEIMLQQTQVKTVLQRFYFPFIKAYPTLSDLAEADVNDVLKKWEGLGYYTRARNLHKTALTCKEKLPNTVTELMTLPGIGKSTAHAIAAFAYNTPVPILDANVKRILYRFFGIKKASDKALWELAYKLFDTKHPFEYNQAMMDLGASLCQGKRVTCKECPLESACLARQDNPLLYPEKKTKKAVPIRSKNIIIHQHNNRFALAQREERFLHGLWGFSEFDTSHTTAIQLGSIVQKYSHFHLHATVYLKYDAIDNHEFFTCKEMESLALSGADHKVLALLEAFLSS